MLKISALQWSKVDFSNFFSIFGSQTTTKLQKPCFSHVSGFMPQILIKLQKSNYDHCKADIVSITMVKE